MHLSDVVRPELIFPGIGSTDLGGVLRAMADGIVAAGYARDADQVFDKLLEREELGSTAMGSGVAIPHCKLTGLSRVEVAVGIATRGVDLDAPDEQPVSVFFVVLSPASSPAEHLRSLAMISKWIKKSENLETLRSLRSKREIFDFLSRPPTP